MRTARFFGVSLLSLSLLTPTAAHAQAPSAGGSCGYAAGQYGMHSLSPLDIRNPHAGGMNVGTFHVQVEYSGVQPGTVLTIVPTSGSLNSGPDLGATGNARKVTAVASGGSYAFAVSQDPRGATRFGKKGTVTNKSRGKRGTTSSAGQSNGAGLYYIQTWSGDQMIGSFSCAVEDGD